MGQAGGKSEKAVAGRKKITVHRTNVFKPKTVDKLVKVFNGLKCFYINADSLPNKLDELKVRAQEVDEGYDIIAITEVYPKNCRVLPGEAELHLQGYELFINDTPGMKRGITLYIKQNLMAKEIKTEDFQESVWAKIKMSGKDILLVGCIYKSPNSDKENLDK